MRLKKELENFEDVQLHVRTFYSKVLQDDMLNPFFSYVKKHHWDKHLRALDNFWDNNLFYSGDYYGKPLEVHRTMNRLSRLESKNFDRWLELFNETVDELFEGEKAALAKQRAASHTAKRVRILPGAGRQKYGRRFE